MILRHIRAPFNSIASRLTPFVAGGLACLLLASCGGGGEGGAGHGGDGGGGSTTPPELEQTPSTVFAAPSGRLCAQRDGDGHCIAPTATAATAQQIIAAATDPNGEVFKVDAFGWRQDWSFETLAGAFVRSAYTYGSERKPLLIGKNRLVLDGHTYLFSRRENENAWLFEAPNLGTIRLSLYDENVISVVHSTGEGGSSGSLQTGIRTWLDGTMWSSEIGLTTDRADAITGDAVKYRGFVHLVAGSGAAVNIRNLLEVMPGNCPVELTVDARFGHVFVAPVQCTSSDGRSVTFSLPGTLTVEDSRLKHDAAQRGTMSVIGLPHDARPEDGAPTLTINVSLDQVDGAFFGAGARSLHLSGSGAGGAFYLKALRQ